MGINYNLRVTDPIARELETIHSLRRWHDCPDGFRWRVLHWEWESREVLHGLPGYGDYVGILTDKAGGILYRRRFLTYYTAETAVLDRLSRVRHQTA